MRNHLWPLSELFTIINREYVQMEECHLLYQRDIYDEMIDDS